MLIGKIGNKKITTSDLKIQGFNNFELNSIIKTSLLTTLAGYLEKDKITVNDNKFYNQRPLENFLSYILNDKRAAPKNFKLKITFKSYQSSHANDIPNNNYNCILSFSGGLDSTAGAMLALDKGLKIKPVWIGFGQKNEKQEVKAIKAICKKLRLNPLIVQINLKNYVDKGWSRWKTGIIPARNLLFASIASAIASKSKYKKVLIYICAHKEEITPIHTDKSLRFFKTCTDIFSGNYLKEIKVETPFAKVTKPEIVSFWIKKWQEKYQLRPEDTVSCYLGNNCGKCKACINRAISFACAGVKMEKYKNNPFSDKEKIIEKDYMGRFDGLDIDRKLDFLYAMGKNRNYLSNVLKEFFDSKIYHFEKKVVKRLANIKKINLDKIRSR